MKKFVRFLRIGLVMVLISAFVIPVYAGEQEDLEEQNRVLEEQIAEERERVAQLQNNIDGLEIYIDEIEAEMSRIEGIIQDYVAQREEKQGQVDQLNQVVGELQATIDEEEAEIAHQYDLMSLRIKFLYENVGTNYIEQIFSSGSFSEAIEKIQYFLEISNYDRKAMVKVQELKAQVETDKASAQEQIEVINGEMEKIYSLQSAQEEQEALYEETRQLKEAELEKMYSEMDEAQAIIDEFSSVVAENEDRINELIAEYEAQQEAERKRREEEAAANAANSGSDDDDDDDYSGGNDYSGSYSSDGFIWPLDGYSYITSYFGYRDDEDVISIAGASYYHQGIDIYAPEGTPIMAVMDGVILSTYWSDGIGNVVIVYHGNGLFTEAHHMCQASPCYVGQYVSQGQTIGYVGQTGIYSTGPHLHFGVSAGSDAYAIADFVNPLNYY